MTGDISFFPCHSSLYLGLYLESFVFSFPPGLILEFPSSFSLLLFLRLANNSENLDRRNEE